MSESPTRDRKWRIGWKRPRPKNVAVVLRRGTSAELRANSPPFEPIKVVLVDVANDIPAIPNGSALSGPRYGLAATYVRWSGFVIGMAWTRIPSDGLEAQSHAASIWDQLAGPLRARASSSGTEVHSLPTAGLGAIDRPTPAEGDTPHITVVVATKDRPKLLDECLRSLLLSRYPSYDIVVVDNGSSPAGTAEVVNELNAGSRLSLEHEKVPGLSAAHNRGVEVARGEIIAFTDDDVLVDEYWLDALAAAFASDPTVASVTGLILPRSLATQTQWWCEASVGYSKGFEPRRYNLDRHRPNDTLFPYTAGRLGSGANMAFRKAVLDRIGRFDPALGTGSGAFGGDDLAAFFEVVAGGDTLVYEPGAIVQHEHPATEQGLRRQVFGYGAGLTAYLTRTVTEQPSRAFGMVSKAPRALSYAFSAGSHRNRNRPAGLPARLRLVEAAGMAVGPMAYLRARRRSRRAATGC